MNFKNWFLITEQDQTVKQFADEFYNTKILKNPEWNQCKVGIPGSGNCSWFAREFYSWAEKNNYKPKIILFPNTDRERQLHIVPVINGYIIDYIQAFSNNKPYLIFPIGSPQINQRLTLASLHPNAANHYKEWYDEFIYAEDINNANQIMKKQKDYQSFEVGPYEAPSPESKPS